MSNSTQPKKIHDRVCSGCGRPVMTCEECGATFYAERNDALTCSTICRVHKHRRIARAKRKAEAAAVAS